MLAPTFQEYSARRPITYSPDIKPLMIKKEATVEITIKSHSKVSFSRITASDVDCRLISSSGFGILGNDDQVHDLYIQSLSLPFFSSLACTASIVGPAAPFPEFNTILRVLRF